MLRTLVLSAAAAGLAAGLLTAVLQEATTTPLILEAERYESGEASRPAGSALGFPDDVAIGTHDHLPVGVEASTPAGGLQRTVSTSLATVVVAIGFALALLGSMLMSARRIDGPMGLAFGVAGFAAVALAPALGLPPEIPGSAAADLGARQAWWMFAAAATAAGLAALLLGRQALARVLGLGLIVAPHLLGPPEAGTYASTAPAELAGRFVAASLAVSAVFWAVLGFLSGAIYRRLAAAE